MTTRITGWTAGEDPTIRPELRSSIHAFAPGATEKMAASASAAWSNYLPGPAWIMPLSHWAFELDFGSKAWLPTLLKSVHVEPYPLADRTDASPLEFQPGEQADLTRFLQTLLDQLAT